MDNSGFEKTMGGPTLFPSLVRLEGITKYPCPDTEVAREIETKAINSFMFKYE